jgi:hypothetical protein
MNELNVKELHIVFPVLLWCVQRKSFEREGSLRTEPWLRDIPKTFATKNAEKLRLFEMNIQQPE